MEHPFIDLGHRESHRNDLVFAHESWLRSLSHLWSDREVRSFSKLDEVKADPAQHRTLLIIGPEEHVNPFQALVIRQRMDVPVGLVTGRNFRQVKERYLRPTALSEAPGRDVLIDRTRTGKAVQASHRWIFPDGSLRDGEETESVLRERCRVLAVTSHGRSDVMYLPHSILCGRNDAYGKDAGEVRQAACAQAEDACFFKGRRIPLDRLRTQILFLNSCMSVSGSVGIFSRRFCLDAAAFANRSISHFIGSPIVHHGTFSQTLLFSILLNQGLSLGEALQAVEDMIELPGLDVKSHLIFGDPASRFEPTASERVARVTTAGEYRNKREIQALYIPRGLEASTALTVESSPIPVYCASTRAGHFLFAEVPLASGRYRWSPIGLDRIKKRFEKEALNPIRRLKMVRTLGLHPARLSGRIADLENRLAHLRKGVRHLATEGGRLSKLDRTFQLIARKKQEIDGAIMDDLLKRSHGSSFHLPENYRGDCIALAVEGHAEEYGTCAICGQPTRETLWQHRLDSHFSRITVQCFRCGYLSDEPSDAPLSGSLTPVGESFRLGRELAADLALGKPAPKGALVDCTLIDTKRFGVEATFTPAVLKSQEHRFVIPISSSLVPHHFWLRAYLVHDHQVYVWGANVWLHQDDPHAPLSAEEE